MTEITNPLISKIRIPGETFQLPSRGLFYTNGELSEDVTNGEVEIYPMTTIDEITFNSPDKLLSGKAITEVFSRCIPQILKPHELLAKDVDFLLVGLRMVTFGAEIEATYIHSCNEEKSHKYKINVEHIVKTTQKFDPTALEREYQMDLPNGQHVCFRPMIYRDVIRMYDITAAKKSEFTDEKQLEEMVITMMSGIIAQVDDITDEKLIEEWLRALKLGWKRLIEEKISGISDWGVNYNTPHICKECNEQIEIYMTANPVEFFFRQ